MPAGAGLLIPTSGFFAAGSQVTIEALPAAGFAFRLWGAGAAEPTHPSTFVTLSIPTKVTAYFRSLAGIQSIEFAPIGDRTLGDPPITLSATASSGLPVTFELGSGPAFLEGDRLTLSGVGVVVVRAVQIGDGQYAPATAEQVFRVLNPLLTLKAIPAAGGVLAASPASPDGRYAPGTEVRITARAYAGFLFTGFGAALQGHENPRTLVMSQSQTVSAGFAVVASEQMRLFGVRQGAPMPEPQLVELPQGTLVPQAEVIAGTGGAWLEATVTTLAVVRLSLQAEVVVGLTPGCYTGSVLVSSMAGKSAIPVMLCVEAAGIAGPILTASNQAAELAPEALFTARGVNLALAALGSQPLREELGGLRLTLTDAQGTARPAPLLYFSPGEVYFLVPVGTALGPGTLSVQNVSGAASAAAVRVAAVSPGLFSADSTGSGAASGTAVHTAADGSKSTAHLAACDPSGCAAVPIDLGGPEHQVLVSLYATGVRGRSSLAAVRVVVGGAAAEVLYAGPQTDYAGLDRVDLRLPRSLAGRGQVEILLTVDGQAANPVHLVVK